MVTADIRLADAKAWGRALASSSVRADAPLGIAAVDVRANGRPERFNVAEMAAEGMPFQPGLLAAQGCEGGCSKPTSLVVRMGVRLLHPAQ